MRIGQNVFFFAESTVPYVSKPGCLETNCRTKMVNKFFFIFILILYIDFAM